MTAVKDGMVIESLLSSLVGDSGHAFSDCLKNRRNSMLVSILYGYEFIAIESSASAMLGQNGATKLYKGTI